MNSKRKAVQDKIYKVMSQLDPTGKNKKFYEDMFNKMSDKDFHEYMLRIRSGEDVLYLYSANLVDNLSVKHVTDVAKANNVKNILVCVSTAACANNTLDSNPHNKGKPTIDNAPTLKATPANLLRYPEPVNCLKLRRLLETFVNPYADTNNKALVAACDKM